MISIISSLNSSEMEIIVTHFNHLTLWFALCFLTEIILRLVENWCDSASTWRLNEIHLGIACLKFEFLYLLCLLSHIELISDLVFNLLLYGLYLRYANTGDFNDFSGA